MKKLFTIFIAVFSICLAELCWGADNSAYATAHCPALRIIFARGSGAEVETNDNYQEFKNTIEAKIGGWGIDHDYLDLDYEAVGIGIDQLDVLIGAFFGAGDIYKFGDSVDKGVELLTSKINECPDAKYVLGGYSQGAMVVSQGIHSIDSSKIIYAATFGDPKIYLPEGKAWFALAPFNWVTDSDKNLIHMGVIPAACKNQNLSEYRMYVPDCYAYEGMLGSYRPYQPSSYSGKLGTWCNSHDALCSSYISISSHTAYVSDGLYEDASKVIATKISEAFSVKSDYVSLHDTAILLDSTGSMSALIGQFRAKAIEIANRTFDTGGRVALYDYRDINGGYEPKQWCNFSTCTKENFREILFSIPMDGGGDEPESLLSAGVKVMKELDWHYGSTKSVVVLTDASFHDPDIDSTTLADVAKLSKKIDPVNFYLIVPDNLSDIYTELTTATDGAVFPLSLLSTEIAEVIMSRYDSLPRVEEMDEAEVATLEDVPVLTNANWRWISDTEVELNWSSTSKRTLVVLNGAILGVSEQNNLILRDLDRNLENILRLIPLGETVKGVGAEINLSTERWVDPSIPTADDNNSSPDSGKSTNSSGSINSDERANSDQSPSSSLGVIIINGKSITIPKAPDTGAR